VAIIFLSTSLSRSIGTFPAGVRVSVRAPI